MKKKVILLATILVAAASLTSCSPKAEEPTITVSAKQSWWEQQALKFQSTNP